MKPGFLKRIFGATERSAVPSLVNRHIRVESMPSVVYAIGDVHGCLDQLRSLERRIIEDSATVEGTKLLVMLGDYIDRGPNSAGVIDYLVAKPPPAFKRICLLGNHEVMASSFFERPHPGHRWLEFGGAEMLQSYGISTDAIKGQSVARMRQTIEAHLPHDHLDFLRSLSWTLSMPGWLFVHAGLRPGVPLHDQHPDDLFWIREEFFDGPGWPQLRVVHGHTPSTEPVITPHRICVDTGAYATGRLTALRVTPDGATAILQSS